MNTKNFKVDEFKCKCCGSIPDNHAWKEGIKAFQRFRNWYNRTMIVNSGYRCPSHNKKIHGVQNSQHTIGVAADFSLPDEYKGFSKEKKTEFRVHIENQWWKICEEDGCGGGVGWYEPNKTRKGWFHLDRRAVRTKWDG